MAPLIDQVMTANEGIYVKSHVCSNAHPVPAKNKRPHIELHLTIRAAEKEKPVEKLQKAIAELSCLVKANGGEVIVE